MRRCSMNGRGSARGSRTMRRGASCIATSLYLRASGTREAVQLGDSPETRSALFAALERTPAITDRIYAPGGPSPAGDETQWIEIAPDGKTLAVGDAGRTVEFFDVVGRKPIAAVDVGS